MTSDRRAGRAAHPLVRALVAAGLGLVALAASDPARAQAVGQQRIGTTTGSFLKIGIGARAIGMGGAFVAVANDPSTIYWNPAGLASLVRREAAISYVQWPADITYNHLAYIAPVKKLGGSVGVQLGVLSTDIQETTEERPFGTGVTFSYADWQAGVTYSSRLTDRLLVGVGAKYVHQDLGADVGGTSASNVLLDLGTIYYLGISSVRIGMTMAHFGPDFSPGGRFQSPNNGDVRDYDGFSPPTTFRFGVAWEPIERENHRLTTTLEFDQPSDNQFDSRAGFEYEWSRRFAVRTGYDVNASELKWSAGAGFYPEFGTIRGTVDYAYTDGGVLGAIHRVTIGGRF